MNEELLTAAETAAMLGMSTSTISRILKKDAIP